jgi:sulfopyruvate decarboxylase subunit alpha
MRMSRLGEIVIAALDAADIQIGTYVADHVLDSITDQLRDSEDFGLLTVTREDEGLGILVGAYAAGTRGVSFMQSSGFGLCINALGSVVLPYQIPIPMFVGLRGGAGEFNVAQLLGGQSVAPICQTLGVPYFAPASHAELQAILPGVLETCFSTERAVCVGIGRSLAS